MKDDLTDNQTKVKVATEWSDAIVWSAFWLALAISSLKVVL